jgi:spermidine/putrescine transport system substrate-binding protein
MSGDLWIAQVYNGDVFYRASDRKDIKFVNPKEGFNVWGDAYCLSSDAKNKDEAFKLLNYLLKPDMSARSVNKFYYATSIDGAEKYINKKMLGNPIIYPSLELLKKGEVYIDIGETNRDYTRIFSSMK